MSHQPLGLVQVTDSCLVLLKMHIGQPRSIQTLDMAWVHLQTILRILQSLIKCFQFNMNRREVAQYEHIIWVLLQTLHVEIMCNVKLFGPALAQAPDATSRHQISSTKYDGRTGLGSS